ncbi:MAG: response regulator, partial [Chloroflexi bacterium]|nr:response regulator [Chloroflexota bacterium]
MAVPIVILTPTKAFGEWIHQALDEAGGYVPALAVTGPEAVELQKSIAPAIFVLDADFAETTLKQFVDALRSFNPDIKIVIIPSEKGRDEDSLAVLEADAYLGKPFYLPDLLENLERVIQQAGLQNIDRPPEKKTPAPKKSKTQSRTSIPPPPEWLQDVDLAAQHLTRLSLESTSQAALITRGDEIWAYAGELPQPAAKKLAASLATYWEDEGGDLARFIQLEETGEEHMMYATSLGGDFVLALVFDAATPFSKIRSQAGQLARALAAPVGDQPKEILQEDTAPAFEEPDEILASAPEPLLEDVPPSIPDDWLPGSSPSH